MAEYIDRNLIEWYGCNFEKPSCKNRECSGCSHAECSHTQVMQIPTADVIERVKYEKIIEENKALKKCITNITNEQLRTAFEIKDSIKEIRKLQEQTRWTEDMKEWDNYNKILSILHKIGGTK